MTAFRGIRCGFVMHPGRVTILRLIKDVGDYHLLYMTGTGVESELRGGRMPSLDVELDGDIRRLVKEYNGQHYAICYGDVSERIEDLARMLNIRAVRI